MIGCSARFGRGPARFGAVYRSARAISAFDRSVRFRMLPQWRRT
jgi:hypothetical protein